MSAAPSLPAPDVPDDRSPTVDHRATGGPLAWVLAAALLTGALLHLTRFADFLSDDALISLRYAQRLNAGAGLTWTDGEWVEGYSNLLWVLMAAAFGWTGLDLVLGPRLFGSLGFLAAIWAASIDPARPLRPEPARLLSGGLLLALCGSMAAWALGGLEPTFLGALVAWALIAVVRWQEGRGPVWLPAALLAAVVLTRIDAAVLWVAALAGLALGAGPRALVRGWPLWFWPAAVLGGQQAFRVLYYGDWVPNTARVKVSLTWARTWVGLDYVGRGGLAHGVLLLGALGAPLFVGRGLRVVLPLVVGVGWLAYVAFVGGDFFQGWRQLVPALPALALAVSEAATRSCSSARARAAAVIAVGAHAWLANADERVLKAQGNGGWVWDGRILGDQLRGALGPLDPYLAVDAAGSLPFATGFRSLDMLGLTDAWLPRHPPPGWGKGGLGHDLGNGRYVWRRAPDIIAFNGALGAAQPHWLSGRQLVARDDFLEVFQQVRFAATRPDGSSIVGVYYFRRADGPLGIRITEDRIEIPAWFLVREGSEPARVGRGDRVYVALRPERPAGVPRLTLPAGTWRVSLPEGVSLDVTCRGRSASRRRRADPAVLHTFAGVEMDLTLWTAPGTAPLKLGDLVLERTGDPASLGCGPNLVIAAEALPPPARAGTPVATPGLVDLDEDGVLIELPGLTHGEALELGLDGAVPHVLEWVREGEKVHTEEVEARGAKGVRPVVVTAPPEVAARGYDAVRVRPKGGPSVLAYIRSPEPGP